MAGVLGEVGYRGLSRDCNRQRLAVARRLWREGFSERLLRLLWAYAQVRGQHPDRLFAWWVDRPSRAVEKADEMRQRSEWAERLLRRMEAEEHLERGPAAPVIPMRRDQA